MDMTNQDQYIETNRAKHFLVNQKLSIKRTFADDEENYPSYVKDVKDDLVFVDIPVKGGVAVPLYQDSEVEVILYTKDGLLVGESVVDSIETGRVGGIWLTIPEYLQKIQRREFVRCIVSLPVRVLCYLPGDDEYEEIAAESCNIGGGGIAVKTKKPLLKNRSFMVSFVFSGQRIELKTKVVHIQFDPKEKAYITGLQFVEISDRTSDFIHKAGVQYLLEMRKKGLA